MQLVPWPAQCHFSGCHPRHYFGTQQSSAWRPKTGWSPLLSCVAACGCARSRGVRVSGTAHGDKIFQLPQSPKDDKISHMKIAVVELEGKGCGIVATAEISRGEAILRERPLLSLPNSFQCDVHALLNGTSLQQLDDDLNMALTHCTDANQARFWQLSDCHADDASPKTAAGIALTNALQLGAGGGLLVTSARFNHSCRPNVQGHWDKMENGGMAVWHALRDIAVGEELCFSYVDPYDSNVERHSTLHQLFKFQCRFFVTGKFSKIFAF